MIVPNGGVFIPDDRCGELAEILAHRLTVERNSSPRLLEIWQQLRHVSDASGSGFRQSLSEALMADTDVMTANEYAEATGLSDRRVRQMCQTGDLDAYRNASGHWRIPIKETAWPTDQSRWTNNPTLSSQHLTTRR